MVFGAAMDWVQWALGTAPAGLQWRVVVGEPGVAVESAATVGEGAEVEKEWVSEP